jgi:(p)ppGpp synthase/HD superfamily hydrolase
VTFSARFDDALAFAACAHRSQVRKGTPDPGVPYIVHPMHVATILRVHGFDEDLCIAGLLHDTVEDCGSDPKEIAAQFGADVADLVCAVSEQKTSATGEKRPWRDRKQDQLDHMQGAGPRVSALKCADALHNAAQTVLDLERAGATVWKRFNAGPADTVWYYRQIVALAGTALGADNSLVRALGDVVDKLEAASSIAGPT